MSDEISIQSKLQLKIILHEILKQGKWHLKPIRDEIFIQTKSQSKIILHKTSKQSQWHLKPTSLGVANYTWNCWLCLHVPMGETKG